MGNKAWSILFGVVMAQRPPHLSILHEDDLIVAVVKPPGIPTAHAPRGETSVYSLLREKRPFVGVVSRLDEPVSGVVLFGKTGAAAASLAEQFQYTLVRASIFEQKALYAAMKAGHPAAPAPTHS